MSEPRRECQKSRAYQYGLAYAHACLSPSVCEVGGDAPSDAGRRQSPTVAASSGSADQKRPLKPREAHRKVKNRGLNQRVVQRADVLGEVIEIPENAPRRRQGHKY